MNWPKNYYVSRFFKKIIITAISSNHEVHDSCMYRNYWYVIIILGLKSGRCTITLLILLFIVGDEFGEPIIAERMIRIADNPMSKGTSCFIC